VWLHFAEQRARLLDEIQPPPSAIPFRQNNVKRHHNLLLRHRRERLGLCTLVTSARIGVYGYGSHRRRHDSRRATSP